MTLLRLCSSGADDLALVRGLSYRPTDHHYRARRVVHDLLADGPEE